MGRWSPTCPTLLPQHLAGKPSRLSGAAWAETWAVSGHSCSWKKLTGEGLPVGPHSPHCTPAGSHVRAGAPPHRQGARVVPQSPMRSKPASPVHAPPLQEAPAAAPASVLDKQAPGQRQAVCACPNYLQPARLRPTAMLREGPASQTFSAG